MPYVHHLLDGSTQGVCWPTIPPSKSSTHSNYSLISNMHGGGGGMAVLQSMWLDIVWFTWACINHSNDKSE